MGELRRRASEYPGADASMRIPSWGLVCVRRQVEPDGGALDELSDEAFGILLT